ncbi:hypothetical protein [Spirosoma pomorum]
MLRYLTIISAIISFSVFITSSCLAERFTITGKLNKTTSLSEVHLYKFNNMFSRDLITKISIRGNEFNYSADLKEVDTYLLVNPATKYSILFVWDGNIEFIIDEVDFSSSKVLNSPLTKELRQFDSIRIARFIEPVKKIDTLLSNSLKLKSSTIDSLRKEHTKIYRESREGFDTYKYEYIRNRPDSFISLYKLTDIDGVPETTEEKELVNSLSENLKKHSRTKNFIKIDS